MDSRSNRPPNILALSLAYSNFLPLHRANASSSVIFKMELEDSRSLRVASKSWSISLGIQATQSSNTVRVRCIARFARVSPKCPPPLGRKVYHNGASYRFLASEIFCRYTTPFDLRGDCPVTF